ncbi:MAG: PilN domain-containing protein [Candidatus Omnitrophota bacterium]
MIEINLVPVNLRKKEAQGAGETLALLNIPKEILLGFGSIFLSLLILIHLGLIGTWIVKFGQHLVYKVAWQKMLPDKSNLDSINQELQDLRGKTSIITDITSKKAMLWSQKLNVLSDVMPKGVWLKKITWKDNVVSIEGSVVSKFREEITIAGNFVSNLKKEEGFAKGFSSIELSSVNRSKKGMTEIVDFIITAKVK